MCVCVCVQVLCWGSSQVMAYTATLRVVTSQADRAEQIIGYVETGVQQYSQSTGAAIGAALGAAGSGVEMKQGDGTNNV